MSDADLLALEALSDDRRLDAERVAVAPYFDPEHYARTLPELPDDVTDLLTHFCTTGWRELRSPCAGFDVWWYWVNHLDPAEDTINPLVHHAMVGREAGLSTAPESVVPRPAEPLPADRPIRRACLFAGFDAAGIVDEAALQLITELARFSDVFCLYDNYLPDDELAKLRSVSVDAWAIRHGAYDFGSYSMLARDLVGWQRLQEYDEVLFVNDSSYLLRPLDDVFARMDAKPCAWWGMQATKGISMTRGVPENVFDAPIDLDVVRTELLPRFEESTTYDFLLGSYFLAFRRPVLDDPLFRRLVDGVVAQPSKRLVIQKYEIGLTHLLIGRRHLFSSYMPALYPFHPVYTEWAFTMIAAGFPLLKRFLLYQNHYDVPGLARWKQRVLELVPDAAVDVFEENLLRTAPADRLERSFSIELGEDGEVAVPTPMTPVQFRRADPRTPKDPWTWAFAVDPATGLLPDNSRAILEQIRHDPTITKVVLTRSRRLHLSGTNLEFVSERSPAGRERLLRAGVLFLKERPLKTLGLRGLTSHRIVVAVRDGLPLTSYAQLLAPPRQRRGVDVSPDGPLEMRHTIPNPAVTAVLTASPIDHAVTVAAHWPAKYADGWRTGLPAHDHLVTQDPPPDVAAEEAAVRALLGDRRLVLLATSPRSSGGPATPYPYDRTEIDELVAWAHANGAVWGVRDHPSDVERAYLRAFGESALDLSVRRFPSTQAVLRATDVVVTDHDGIGLDFTLTGRPVVSFAHDLEAVADRLVFDLDHLFPGPVCRDFTAFRAALDTVLDEPDAPQRHRYLRTRDLLVDRVDDQSTARTIAHVKLLLEEAVR